MIEFKHYSCIGKDGEETELTIASGPVIVEKGRVLLDKHGDDKFWKFPGGKQLDTSNFLENAMREVDEELGLEVKLIGKPCVMTFEREHNKKKEYVILVHYLAKRSGEIKAGRDVREYNWFDVDSLPKDCATNIKPVLKYFGFI